MTIGSAVAGSVEPVLRMTPAGVAANANPAVKGAEAICTTVDEPSPGDDSAEALGELRECLDTYTRALQEYWRRNGDQWAESARRLAEELAEESRTFIEELNKQLQEELEQWRRHGPSDPADTGSSPAMI